MMWYELYESNDCGTATIYTCGTERFLLDYINQYNGDCNLGVDLWENPEIPEKVKEFNICTCEDCGYPYIHDIKSNIDTFTCSRCGFEEEPCFFPDYNKENIR